MRHTLRLSAILVIVASLSAPSIRATECTIKKAGRLETGHNGLSAAFTGEIGGRVIMAGGSDFENEMPWRGGVKTYYSDIYELVSKDGEYVSVNTGCHLPQPLAYGCSVSDGRTMYCFGGWNDKLSSSAVIAVTVSGTVFSADSIAALPAGFSASAAALCSGKIYVHGTSATGNRLFAFTPSSKSWKELSACPDKPIEEGGALVYQHNGREAALYLIGGRGMDGDSRYISSSIWEYLPAHDTWNRKFDLSSVGEISKLMYCGAIAYGSAHIVIAGGDNGIEMLRRDSLERRIAAAGSVGERDSLKSELENAFTSHKGFNTGVYAYHTITNTIEKIGEYPSGMAVCTSLVPVGGNLLMPSGESRPGVRSSDIVEITIDESRSFGWINYTVIVIYLLGMLLVGLYFSRRARTTEHFFKGGGSIPWWAAGISIFATALSAITFLSIPAKAYMADWGMFVFNLAILLIVPIVIHFYLPFFRKLNVASAYEYLEQRFSPVVRTLASAFFCMFMFARVAIVLFLPSLALNAVTGLDVYLCILLMGLVTIAYCTMGGIEAVVWGDVIQGFILVGGALISLVYLICGVDGGIGEVVRIAVDDSKFNILDFSLDWTRPVFWVAILGGVANQLLTYTSDQSVVQRYITVKDTASTKKSLWLNGLLSVPITFIFFSIGTGLYVFFKSHPDLLNIGMNNTDSIFPHFIMCELPTGIAGLLVAAIFAAAMSTLSANINSTSTVMTEDFFARFRKGVDDAGKMRFARWTGVFLGGFGVVMAIVLATFDIASLWDSFNFFLGLLTSGLGGLFMMGIFTKRIGTRSALTGFVCSIVVLLLCNRFSYVSTILYGFIGLVSCFIIGYLSSFIYGRGR